MAGKYDISAVHDEHRGSNSELNASGTRGTVHGFTSELDKIPKGYYWSPAFLGTMFATEIGLSAATEAFGLAAPMLGIINNDIDPDPNISWVSLIYPVTMAVGLLLVGRLSDLFGRRWFSTGAASRAFLEASSVQPRVALVLFSAAWYCLVLRHLANSPSLLSQEKLCP